MEKFYVTTPIYYPSAKLHIGHAYTTVAGDVISRYKKQKGFDVFYLTGSDEHGQKIESKAEENGQQPKEYVDEIVAGIKELWNDLEIEYNRFIRTTDEDHKEVAANIFDQLLKQGDIYLSEYTGLYCKSDESYYTETQAVNGMCPDCGSKLEVISEESYFFKCSKYTDRLLEYFKEHPGFLEPQYRLTELINNFIEPGLEDLAVSRTSFTWGIPVKGNEKHVIYVWVDALTNYLTAIGYGSDNDANYKKYWAPDVQLVGKEITRFHAIYWPMILMALDLPLPKKIFSHGWLLMENDKMSKSKGNVIYPDSLIKKYGADTLRYYLMREVPFGADGQFTPTSFITRINTNLANDLSNLMNRTISMTNKYFGGEVADSTFMNENFEQHSVLLEEVKRESANDIENFEFHKALEKIWKLVSATNKLIDLEEPWVLGKDVEENKERLSKCLYTLLATLQEVANLIYPFMPETAAKMYENLNVKSEGLYTEAPKQEYITPAEPIILYQRLDVEEEVENIRKQMEADMIKAQSKLN